MNMSTTLQCLVAIKTESHNDAHIVIMSEMTPITKLISVKICNFNLLIHCDQCQAFWAIIKLMLTMLVMKLYGLVNNIPKSGNSLFRASLSWPYCNIKILWLYWRVVYIIWYKNIHIYRHCCTSMGLHVSPSLLH